MVGTSYKQTWYRSTRRCYIPNIKALGLSFSDQKNFKVSFFVSVFKVVTLPRWGQFWPQGHHMNKLGKGPIEDATTKYQMSMPSSFREEFWSFPFLFPICDPKRDQSWPQGHYMNRLGRDPPGDATYQISKLYALQFQRNFFFEVSFFNPMFKLVTLGCC